MTAPLKPTITIEDFARVDMRLGVIRTAAPFPEARKPAYKLTIDFGALGQKQSSAQITGRYQPQALVGRRVIAVVNLPPRQIGPFVSEVLVLGIYDPNGQVVLLEAGEGPEPGRPVA